VGADSHPRFHSVRISVHQRFHSPDSYPQIPQTPLRVRRGNLIFRLRLLAFTCGSSPGPISVHQRSSAVPLLWRSKEGPGVQLAESSLL